MQETVQQPRLAGAMSLQEILDAQGVEYDMVPAWGGRSIAIMSITAGEVLEWIESKDDPEKRKAAGLLLIARSLVGEDGQRLCQTPEDEQRMVESLKGKDSRTCNRIVERIVKLNGIMQSAEQEKNGSGSEG